MRAAEGECVVLTILGLIYGIFAIAFGSYNLQSKCAGDALIVSGATDLLLMLVVLSLWISYRITGKWPNGKFGFSKYYIAEMTFSILACTLIVIGAALTPNCVGWCLLIGGCTLVLCALVGAIVIAIIGYWMCKNDD